MQETTEKRTNQPQELGRLLPQHQLNTRDYSHIELTDAEVQDALLFAKIRKAAAIEEQENKHKRQVAIQQQLQPWTYEELKQHVLNESKKLPFKFQVDDDNRNVFHLLLQYFSNAPAFEENTYVFDGEPYHFSLNKGICLYSEERGTGKSVLMDLFSKNRKSCFKKISTKTITSFFESSGSEVIKRFSTPWYCERMPEFFFQKPVGICFDDLGDEEIKNHYGNKENVMARVLSALYDDTVDRTVFKYFHATTNLTGPELEQMYDKRVRSRMREMFNWIVLPGKDRRR